MIVRSITGTHKDEIGKIKRVMKQQVEVKWLKSGTKSNKAMGSIVLHDQAKEDRADEWVFKSDDEKKQDQREAEWTVMVIQLSKLMIGAMVSAGFNENEADMHFNQLKDSFEEIKSKMN